MFDRKNKHDSRYSSRADSVGFISMLISKSHMWLYWFQQFNKNLCLFVVFWDKYIIQIELKKMFHAIFTIAPLSSAFSAFALYGFIIPRDYAIKNVVYMFFSSHKFMLRTEALCLELELGVVRTYLANSKSRNFAYVLLSTTNGIYLTIFKYACICIK